MRGHRRTGPIERRRVTPTPGRRDGRGVGGRGGGAGGCGGGRSARWAERRLTAMGGRRRGWWCVALALTGLGLAAAAQAGLLALRVWG